MSKQEIDKPMSVDCSLVGCFLSLETGRGVGVMRTAFGGVVHTDLFSWEPSGCVFYHKVATSTNFKRFCCLFLFTVTAEI